MSSYRLVLNTPSVLDDTQGRVPELAGIKNKIGRVVSDLFRDFFGIDLIEILSLIPVNGDLITGFEFGEVVEGVQMAKGVGPGKIAPAMGGKNGGCLILFWSTKIRNLPDALLENFLPVFSWMNFSSNSDGVDDEAIF